MRAFDLRVVLVRTLYDTNIGASSRAMDNMGVSQLILIGRQCEITYQAQQAAASGQTGFQNRREYESWDEFFKNESDGLRIAFSARDGRGRPLWDFNRVLNWIRDEEPRMKKTDASALPVYLIFGPEDWGLSHSDLELAHFNANIPTYGDNSSLNLAQAVLIALFMLRQNWGGERTRLDGQQLDRFGGEMAEQRERENVFPEKTLHTWLTEMGFDLSKKKINTYTVLKRMLLHNVPTPKELRMLEIVLQQGIRKLREYNEMRARLKEVDPTYLESKDSQS